jgi:glutamate-1-semialdehyde 2,1-aminomutase
VIKFEGHYHGWLDSVLVSVGQAAPARAEGAAGASTRAVLAVPGSAGQHAGSWEHLAVLPWNDLPLLEARLAERDVAAVLMEPAMCNAGAIAPLPGYLEGARKACTASGTILIFDEVITGFRLAPGGAQERFGVTPDLATFGKCLANGFPAAALAGRAEIMDLFAHGGVVHGGTYNAHPVCMAAAYATLRALSDGRAIAAMEVTGKRLMQGIGDILPEQGIVAQVAGFPQIFHVAFGLTEPARQMKDLGRSDRQGYVRFCTELLRRRVRALERGAWFLSSAHDSTVIDATLEAVRGAAQAIGDTDEA